MPSPARAPRVALLCLALAVVLQDCSGATGGPDAGAGGASGTGGGSGAGGGSGSADAGSLSFDLAALMDDLTALADSQAEATSEVRRAAELAFLQARPEVLLVGTSPDGVWAILEGNIPLLVLDNRAPDPESELDAGLEEVSPPGTRKTDVPRGTRARLVNTLGNAFVDDTRVVAPLLRSRGYQVVQDPGTVDSLRQLSGDGVLYYSSHGGLTNVLVFNKDGKVAKESDGGLKTTPTFGLWTSTPFDAARPNQYLADLQAGRLGLGVMLNSYNADRTMVLNATHYWVTTPWVRDGWSFSRDALVWVSACEGMSPAAAGFRASLLEDGPGLTKAGLYAGWTGLVTGKAAVLGGKFVVDRLLGANLAAPKETPPQRSFEVPEVWGDLRKRGLHLHPIPGGTTELTYQAKASSTFGMLAPSLEYVRVDEPHDQAVLTGRFGTPPAADQKVTVGGTEVAVAEWTEDTIKVTLPRSGPGAHGDVVVAVRGHDSNARQLTEWTMHLRFRWADPDVSPNKVEGPLLLRFRADVGEYREKPGTPPVKHVRYAMGTRESGGTLVASGSHTEGSCTTTYSGSGTLGAAGFEYVDPMLSTWIALDPVAKQLALTPLLGSAMRPWTHTVACKDSLPITTPLAFLFGPVMMGNADYGVPTDDDTVLVTLPALFLAFDDQWGLSGGTFQEDFAGSIITWEWDAVAAVDPPDPEAAR